MCGKKSSISTYIRYAVYSTLTCCNSRSQFLYLKIHRWIGITTAYHLARCIYNARGDLARSDDIYLDRRLREIRGVAGNTYYYENICKSLPRDVDVGDSPFASLFRATFFHLQSPCHPVAPYAIPAARIRRSSPAARHRIGYTAHTGVVMFYG